MARDRKRAKQRSSRRDRRDRPAVPAAARARGGRVDEPAVDARQSKEPAAPAPLEHATEAVETSKAHLVAGRVAAARLEPEVFVAPGEEPFADEHEDEPAVAEAPARGDGPGGGLAAVPGRAADVGEPHAVNRVINFLRASWRELQRVQWPDRRQVAQATGVVLGFVVVAGVLLGLSDLVFSRLVDAIL